MHYISCLGCTQADGAVGKRVAIINDQHSGHGRDELLRDPLVTPAILGGTGGNDGNGAQRRVQNTLPDRDGS